ncbi:pall [Drosophila busckii]|uniref:Pall n=1 Tax=Drosophila busckii TaxID=30019 RepID=A0A0M3QVS7_DROBS|nr:F-box only protein 28 [Drosophila busckii]ALC42919.1 pall [Drosophila busckii]
MNILDLPDTVLMDILEMLSYDEVARKREVCGRFNYICQQVLNTGFNKVVQEHSKNFKRIKAMLPRRESERRNHILARHSDILTSIETRISMLTMTYSKFIDLSICCFIPGRVLDEINSILKLLVSTTKPLRPHEVLQELRDISSMAIEHFDEKIAVNFKSSIKLGEAGPSTGRVVVCGALGDISFSGVNLKRVRMHKVKDATELPCVHSNSSKVDAMVQQAILLANAMPPRGSTTPVTGIDPHRLVRQLQRTAAEQRKLATKVRNLEWSRKAQERRLQEALGGITELCTQVSELKRQLEDVVGKATSSSSGVKRSTVSSDCMPPNKKPKN